MIKGAKSVACGKKEKWFRDCPLYLPVLVMFPASFLFFLLLQGIICGCYGYHAPNISETFDVFVPEGETLGVEVDTQFKIVRFATDSFAKSVAKLHIGDTIVYVDGVSVDGWSLSRFKQEMGQNEGRDKRLTIKPLHSKR